MNENFYPFGVSVGDAQVPVALDGSSPPISLFIPFQFFETSESTLFVSQLLVFIYMQTEINFVNCIIIYMPVVMICNSCYPFCLIITITINNCDLLENTNQVLSFQFQFYFQYLLAMNCNTGLHDIHLL